MVAESLKRFGQAVRSNEVPLVAPGFLRPIDTRLIARELKIEAAAQHRGGNELPHQSEESLDSVERAIIQKLESEWSWQGSELVNNLRAYATRLVGYSINSEFAKLKITATNTLVRLRNENTRAPADLGPLKDAYIS